MTAEKEDHPINSSLYRYYHKIDNLRIAGNVSDVGEFYIMVKACKKDGDEYFIARNLGEERYVSFFRDLAEKNSVVAPGMEKILPHHPLDHHARSFFDMADTEKISNNTAKIVY